MNSLSAGAREKRLHTAVDPNTIISQRAYNLVLTGTVLYGLVINVLLCRQSIAEYIAYRVNPIAFFIGYFVCLIAGIVIAHKSQKPLISFLGYNLIVVPVGLAVAQGVILGGYSPAVVWHAFVTTAGVAVIMTAAGLLFPHFFEKIGAILFFGLIGVLFSFLISFFIPGVNVAITVVATGLFSLYIGYDVYRSQQFPFTVDNAIDSAIDIYLDITNLFLQLLRLFGRANDS